MKEKVSIRDLAYIAIGAALISICSWISIPAPVPFTLQTFAVFCVLGLLGGKRGTIAVLVYILLGAIGMPVFSGFGAGIGVLLGATGGYIIGFLFIGLLVWLCEKAVKGKLWLRILVLVLGLVICYAFGTAWFMAVYARTKGAIALTSALGWCVFPFIVPDLIKMALAVLISERVKGAIR